jgi:hypothetical protein
MATRNRRIVFFCVMGLFLTLGVVVFFVVSAAKQNSRRAFRHNMMELVGHGLHAFHDALNRLPADVFRDKLGRPLCSWRFAILVYLEAQMLGHDNLARWDAFPNTNVTGEPYDIYCWLADGEYPNCLYTTVVAITGPGTAFDGARSPVRLADLESDTILAIELADSGILWAQPGDLPLDEVPESVVNGLDGDGLHVLFADGTVWFLRNDVPFADLKKFFTVEGATQYDREKALRRYACRPTGPGPQSRPQPRVRANASALRKIENVGGEVPHEIFGPDYEYRALRVTIGDSWKGKTEGLAPIGDVKEMHELILDCATVADSALSHLKKLRRIDRLTLKRTAVTDAGLRHLEGVRGLRLVSFDGTNVTDAGLAALAGHNLTWLKIENDSQITDAGMDHLAGMTNLICLQLNGAEITDDGLAKLRRLLRLRELVLRGADIDDDSLKHLAGFRKLRELDLSSTRVRGPGLVHLAGLPQLEVLSLDDTAFSNEDVQHIAGMKRLVVLSLEGTEVSREAVEALTEPETLRTVLLDGQQIAGPGAIR